MSVYRKQWVPPLESRWLSMRNWIRKWKAQILIVTALVFGVGGVIGHSLYSNHVEAAEEKAAADKLHRERWNQITEEAKLCEPHFFVKKKLAAHKLWEVTCIDEDGNISYKYIKGKHFKWYWDE